MALTHDVLERIILKNGTMIIVYPKAVRIITPSANGRLTSVYETNEREAPEMSHTIQWD